MAPFGIWVGVKARLVAVGRHVAFFSSMVDLVRVNPPPRAAARCSNRQTTTFSPTSPRLPLVWQSNECLGLQTVPRSACQEVRASASSLLAVPPRKNLVGSKPTRRPLLLPQVPSLVYFWNITNAAEVRTRQPAAFRLHIDDSNMRASVVRG